ncbi:MAG: hypothetical protein ACJAX4_002888 [Clostridium sp.]|jgi:hypothetical protein
MNFIIIINEIIKTTSKWFLLEVQKEKKNYSFLLLYYLFNYDSIRDVILTMSVNYRLKKE